MVFGSITNHLGPLTHPQICKLRLKKEGVARTGFESVWNASSLLCERLYLLRSLSQFPTRGEVNPALRSVPANSMPKRYRGGWMVTVRSSQFYIKRLSAATVALSMLMPLICLYFKAAQKHECWSWICVKREPSIELWFINHSKPFFQ